MLTGNAGSNVLKGLAGNDVYVVQNASGQAIERLTADPLLGAVNLTGNEFGQALTGKAGVNVLDGRGGSDVLVGGAGKDTFVFATALAATNVDHIGDYSVADDTVRLAKSIFAGLAAGPLDTAAFKNLGAAGASVMPATASSTTSAPAPSPTMRTVRARRQR